MNPQSVEDACRQGEDTVRTYIRQMDRAVDMMRTAVRLDPEMPEANRRRIRLHMRRCQQVVTYGVYALDHLPENLGDRAQAIETHVQAIKHLYDQVSQDYFLNMR